MCEFCVRLRLAGLGGDTGYDLPMTQEQIADAVGLTPVHVNRMLQQLARDGLLTRSKRAVTIGDWKKLVEAGDFDTTYLHVREGDRVLA